jgi:hypothetical protein
MPVFPYALDFPPMEWFYALLAGLPFFIESAQYKCKKWYVKKAAGVGFCKYQHALQNPHECKYIMKRNTFSSWKAIFYVIVTVIKTKHV